MNAIIKGRHREVTPAVRAYAEEKIGKVARILDAMVMETEIEFHTEKNPAIVNSHIVEVTMRTKGKGPVIRAKEAATSETAAIDLVSEKLERQVKKLKGKLADRHGSGPRIADFAPAEPEMSDEEPAQRTVVKTKVLEVKPMTEQEAILQLELLNHDFFVFASAEAEAISVLYRRKDGDYGLIVPSLGM